MSEIQCPNCGESGQSTCILSCDYHEHSFRCCGKQAVYPKGPFASNLTGKDVRIAVGRCAL